MNDEPQNPLGSTIPAVAHVETHDDAAADLRVSHPYLPAIWKDGPGKNLAARHYAARIGHKIKNLNVEIPQVEIEWYQRYSNCLTRRTSTTMIVEEESFFVDENAGFKGQDLVTFLFSSLIQLRRDAALVIQQKEKDTRELIDKKDKECRDFIDKKEREHREALDKHQERADNQNMEYVRLMMSDKKETISLVQKAYQGGSDLNSKLLSTFLQLIESLTNSNGNFIKNAGEMEEKRFSAMMKLVEKVEKPGNVELLIMMVLAPMIPVVVPSLMNKWGIKTPENFSTLLTNSVNNALSGMPAKEP